MPFAFLKKWAGKGSAGKGAASAWSHPLALDRGDVRPACFAMDRQGRALAVWENAGQLWSLTTGPGSDPSFGRLPMGAGVAPRIALNQDGRGGAISVQRQGNRQELSAVLFNPGNEERTFFSSTPKLCSIFATTGEIQAPQIAVDRRGSALVVWCHAARGGYEVLALGYDIRTQSWDPKPYVLRSGLRKPVLPVLAMNRRGIGMVFWHDQSSSSKMFEGIVVCHFLPKERIWSDNPVPIVQATPIDLLATIDFAGNAIVAWTSYDKSGKFLLDSVVFHAKSGDWTEPILLGSAASPIQAKLAMAGNGEALAVWTQNERGRATLIQSHAFQDGRWDTQPTRLDGEGKGIGPMALALGYRGQAALLYIHESASGNAPIVRFRNASEWGSPTRICPPDSEALDHPMIDLCPVGAVAVWKRGSGNEATLVSVQSAMDGRDRLSPRRS